MPKQADIDRLKAVLDDYSTKQGWDEHSQIELLLSFVTHHCRAASESNLDQFLSDHARFETEVAEE